MDSASIFVIGPEGSGTTLVSRCVAGHPDLSARPFHLAPARGQALPATGAIVHLSLPTLRPMRWVDAAELPAGSKVIAVRRSPLHTVYSAYRRFFDDPQAAWQSYLRATALETAYIARHETFCVVYEDLVHHPATVLRALYAHLDVDPGFMPATRFDLRNDDRWQRDPVFAAFVRETFGDLPDVDAPDSPSPDVAAFKCSGTPVVLEDRSGSGIAEAVRAALPPGLEPADAEVRYRVERIRDSASGKPAYRVLVNGQRRFRASTADEVVAWIRLDIDRTVSVTSRNAVFVRAGVVGWRGEAVLLLDPKPGGIRALVAELVRHGAAYYSDAFAMLDADGRVLPYAGTPDLPSGRAPTGLESRPHPEPLKIRFIVSTLARRGARWQPDEVGGVRAAAAILEHAANPGDNARLLALAAKIAPHVTLLRGARPASAAFAPALLAHLDRIRERSGITSRGVRQESVVARARTALAKAAPSIVRPPRFVRIPDLLTREEHADLLSFALGHEAAFTASTVTNPEGAARLDETFRRSGTVYDVGQPGESLTQRLRRLLPHIRRELDIPWFPIGKVECQLAVHREGGFFGCHVDNGEQAVAGRRLTCVYYFHDRPKGFTGGNLKLHESVERGGHFVAGPGHVTIEPDDNTAVFFTSDTFHEVCPVVSSSSEFGRNRFSVNVWFWLGTPPVSLRSRDGSGIERASSPISMEA